MGEFLEFLASGGTGGLIGGILALVKHRQELKFEQARWAHDAVMRDKDLAITAAEAAGRKDVAIIESTAAVEGARAEAEGAASAAQMSAIAATHAADRLEGDELKAAGKWRWALVFSDALRRMIRPAATILLLGSAVGLSWKLIALLGDDGWKMLSSGEKLELVKMAVLWLFTTASATISYWFVGRQLAAR
jgi:hypothetical protein